MEKEIAGRHVRPFSQRPEIPPDLKGKRDAVRFPAVGITLARACPAHSAARRFGKEEIVRLDCAHAMGAGSGVPSARRRSDRAMREAGGAKRRQPLSSRRACTSGAGRSAG